MDVDEEIAGEAVEAEASGIAHSSEVIEHLRDPSVCSTRASERILKPGGRFVLSTPNSAFWIYRILGLFGKTVADLQHPTTVAFPPLARSGLFGQLSHRQVQQLRSRGSHPVYSIEEAVEAHGSIYPSSLGRPTEASA